MNDDTLAKHGEAVGDSAALAVVSAAQNLVDNNVLKNEGGRVPPVVNVKNWS